MMTLKAAGAYIVRLRKDAKLSRLALSKLVDTSDSNLMRIEQGVQEPGIALLSLIIRELNANPKDIVDLVLDNNAMEQHGIKKADEWILQRSGKQNRATELHPDILKLSSQMTDYELGKWVSMGERLLEEARRAR